MTINKLNNAYDPEEFRKKGHQLIDMLADYMQSCLSNGDFPVLPWQEPAEQEKYWKEFFNSDKNLDVDDFFQDFLEKSIHIHHPKYIGHQVVPPLPITALSAMIEAFTNNGMAIYEMGPAAAAMEKTVIDWLINLIGWDDKSNGLMTSGGSLGNLTAMLAARQAFQETDIWEDGIADNLAVMVSSESHYSIERAVKIMGLGEKGIIKIPVDDNFRIKTDMLTDILEKSKKQGLKVIALVGNACSTSTGIYDDLDKLGDFCHDKNIWFHVDAAHGGPAILSEKYKYLVNGIEKADSIVLDFHKMMLAPALTTAVLYKNAHTSYEAFAQKASYLLNKKGEINWWDGAGRTIECTKKPMSVKVFMMIKLYGKELFDEFVTHTFDLAREFASLIESLQEFELAAQPDSNIVCFRSTPEGYKKEKLNELNSSIRNNLKENGRFYIVQTIINGNIYLRVSIMNAFTTIEILKDLLHEIRTSKI
ncbi:pyridoxal phosphate-dependent decarboxylase family protein [Bacteroidota bacterium]